MLIEKSYYLPLELGYAAQGFKGLEILNLMMNVY